jgi:hypothetical protein
VTALAIERVTPTKVIKSKTFPLAANVKAYAGALAMGNIGFAKPGATATNHRPLGIFLDTVDNTGGSAGDKSVEIDLGREVRLVGLKNDTGTPVDAADVFEVVYIKDDQTATADNTGATAAGVCWEYESDRDLVWVELDRS